MIKNCPEIEQKIVLHRIRRLFSKGMVLMLMSMVVHVWSMLRSETSSCCQLAIYLFWKQNYELSWFCVLSRANFHHGRCTTSIISVSNSLSHEGQTSYHVSFFGMYSTLCASESAGCRSPITFVVRFPTRSVAYSSSWKDVIFLLTLWHFRHQMTNMSLRSNCPLDHFRTCQCHGGHWQFVTDKKLRETDRHTQTLDEMITYWSRIIQFVRRRKKSKICFSTTEIHS